MRKGKCEFCGKEFETTNHQKRYCSQACYREASKERFREYYHNQARTIVCDACGREFLTNSPTATTCRDCRSQIALGLTPKKNISYAQIRAKALANPLKSEYRGQRCGGCVTPPKSLMLTPKGEN